MWDPLRGDEWTNGWQGSDCRNVAILRRRTRRPLTTAVDRMVLAARRDGCCQARVGDPSSSRRQPCGAGIDAWSRNGGRPRAQSVGCRCGVRRGSWCCGSRAKPARAMLVATPGDRWRYSFSQTDNSDWRGRCAIFCEGGRAGRPTYLATVACETCTPSLSNSPWIRGAPQSGFSCASWRISARTSPGDSLVDRDVADSFTSRATGTRPGARRRPSQA